jgi:hypothetical protein
VQHGGRFDEFLSRYREYRNTKNAARDAAAEEITMKREEFQEKHPELFASLIDEGRETAQAEFESEVKTQVDAAVAAENERIFGLAGKLFGEEKGRAFSEMAASGVTVDQLAGLEACGFAAGGETAPVAAEQDTKKEILKKLEEDEVELKTGTTSGPTDFMAAVDQYVEEKRVTRAKAVLAVAKSHPELHAEYKAKQGGGE